MIRTFAAIVPTLLVLFQLVASARAADDYTVETAEQAAGDDVSADIRALLDPRALVVKKGGQRTVCTLWLCRELPLEADAATAADVNYPLREGALVGAIQFRRKSVDFRDREVPRGFYTLRYGKQPVDGNHVGTFPTRDFLLLTSAANDLSADDVSIEGLSQKSAESVEASHPGILCLLKPAGGAGATPSLRHLDESDWWVLQAAVRGGSGKQSAMRIDLVVVGYVEE